MSSPNRVPGTKQSNPVRGIGALLPWIASAILLAGLVGAIWWGIDQRNEKNEVNSELGRLRTELIEQSSQTNAMAYRLTATPNGPATASGTAFMPISGSGVASVVNLSAVPEGQTFQLWLFRDDASPPVAGATFAVDDNGGGYVQIPADVGAFTAVGVSVEPEAGSQSPTTPMILQGSASAARG